MQRKQELLRIAQSVLQRFSSDEIERLLGSPIIIVSSPRAGSTLLFEQLQKVPGIWSIGGESHFIFNSFPHLRAENRELDSGALDQHHADSSTIELMRACFLYLARNHQGLPFLHPQNRDSNSSFSLLEKTPRNALNIPFLQAVFPNARFIYLHRDPKENIASITEAWKLGLRTGQFVTFRDLPGWDRQAWCFLLPRGWRKLKGHSLVEVATFQWVESNKAIVTELETMPKANWRKICYQDLIEHTEDSLNNLCRFIGVEYPVELEQRLAHSRTTISPPNPDKWKVYQNEIHSVTEQYEPIVERIRRL